LRVPSVAILRAHLSTVHGISRCPVKSCGRLFESEDAVAKHVESHGLGSRDLAEHSPGIALV
jgi:hypothetical protein